MEDTYFRKLEVSPECNVKFSFRRQRKRGRRIRSQPVIDRGARQMLAYSPVKTAALACRASLLTLTRISVIHSVSQYLLLSIQESDEMSVVNLESYKFSLQNLVFWCRVSAGRLQIIILPSAVHTFCMYELTAS